MRKASVILILIALAAVFAGSLAAETVEAPFRSIELADGVWLYRAPDNDVRFRNALVVERNDGLLVVDSQPTPDAARIFQAQLKNQFGGSARYLILSHPHAEAAGGASAFDDGRTLIAASGRYNRVLADEEYDFAADCRHRFDSEWVTPPRRIATLEIHARTVLADDRNPVVLLPLQRGHSAGDLSVLIPEHKLIYVGSVVYPDRNPYLADGSPEGTLRYFNGLIRDQHEIIVASQGDPVTNQQLRQLRDGLAWVRGQITLQFVNRVPAEEIVDRVLAEEDFGKFFDLDAQPNFARQVLDRAVQEMITDRKKRGYGN